MTAVIVMSLALGVASWWPGGGAHQLQPSARPSRAGAASGVAGRAALSCAEGRGQPSTCERGESSWRRVALHRNEGAASSVKRGAEKTSLRYSMASTGRFGRHDCCAMRRAQRPACAEITADACGALRREEITACPTAAAEAKRGTMP